MRGSFMKILLLTQEPGQLKTDKTTLFGNRSCGLIDFEHRKLGNIVTQLTISNLIVRAEKLFYTASGMEHEIDVSDYAGVLLRTWGDEKQEKLALHKILPFLEKKGIYPDNPSDSILMTCSKREMQYAIDKAGVISPKSFIVDSTYLSDVVKLDRAVSQLGNIFQTKSLDATIYPAYVIKADFGTHGAGVRMFKQGEEKEMKDHISSVIEGLASSKFCLMQEYVKPKFTLSSEESSSAVYAGVPTARSAHYRVVMSRQIHNGFEMIGGIHFQRNGSWVSNSHCPVGTLFKEPLSPENLPQGLIQALTEVANQLQLNQFGADIIVDDDGQFYVLELNDGMGISGDILEHQAVPQKYIKSHTERILKSLSAEQHYDRYTPSP